MYFWAFPVRFALRRGLASARPGEGRDQGILNAIRRQSRPAVPVAGASCCAGSPLHRLRGAIGKRGYDGYIAETLAMIKDPTNVLQFSRDSPATPGSSSPQVAHDGMPAFGCQFTGYCYYVPRFIDIGGPGSGGGSYGFGYVNMHRISPPPHSVDYTMWSKFRNVSCADAKDHGAQASIATGAMMFGCAAAATGVGLAACGISGLGVLYLSNQMATAAKSCAAPYPGPGRW